MSSPRAFSHRSKDFSPPPPITASVYNNAASIRVNRHVEIRQDPDTILALRRQEKALEEELQELLNAQSDGLFKVLGGQAPEEDGFSSTGTSTPTVTSSSRRRDLSPAERYRQRKKKVSLRGARRGIYKSIQSLARVKTEESALVADEIHQNETVLDRIGNWEAKRGRLEERIESIEHASTSNRVQDLHNEASKLEGEIRKLEDALADLKAQHRRLLDEAASTENAVQSKLSSYKAALSLLDSDIKNFLTHPPSSKSSDAALEDSNFLKLPQTRRTLGLARDHWNGEHASLAAKAQRIKEEQEALVEGASVWKDVVGLVDDFEASLGIWLQQAAASTKAPSSLSKGKEKADSARGTSTHDIEEKMSQVTEQLKYWLSVAESKNWKLLVCCIGAELEAFEQAAEVLRESIRGPDESSNESEPNGHGLDEQDEQDPGRLFDFSDPPTATSSSNNTNDKLFDTDDDPDPTLLLEQKSSNESDPGNAWR